MTVVWQVLIGLLTAFIGFLLGYTWKISRRRITYWRARRFWRPFVSGDLKIVVDRFRQFDAFEASGFVGVGGMQAVAEVISFLDDVGFRRLGRTLDIVYHDQLEGDSYGANLICIGGPDAKKVTEFMLKRIEHTIALGDPEQHIIRMHDTKTGEGYSPKARNDRDGRRMITLDYGLLVKCPNPVDRRHSVLVIAGSFGYRVWAGVKLARSPEFLRNQLVSQGVALECLYKTEVIKEAPQRPDIVLMRQI
jgi:hypothetical protein